MAGAALAAKSSGSWIVKSVIVAVSAVVGGMGANLIGNWLKGEDVTPTDIEPGTREGVDDHFKTTGKAQQRADANEKERMDRAKQEVHSARNTRSNRRNRNVPTFPNVDRTMTFPDVDRTVSLPPHASNTTLPPFGGSGSGTRNSGR